MSEKQTAVCIEMSKASPKSWKKLEIIIKDDNVSKLKDIIETSKFSEIWRPKNAKQDETLLHMASRFGSTESIKYLIEVAKANEVSLDEPNSEGENSLMKAARLAKVESVKELLKAGVYVNARNDVGNSVLHVLIYELLSGDSKGEKEELKKCFKVLLDHNQIDLEAHNNSGYTPLMTATIQLMKNLDHPKRETGEELFDLLLLKGAFLDATDERGVTVRELSQKHSILSKLMSSRSVAPPDRPLMSMVLDSLIMGESGKQICTLVNNRSQKDSKLDPNSFLGSKSILFYAVDKSNTGVVQVLLEVGANPWLNHFGGELCIERCLARGNPDILDLLLEGMKKSRNIKVVDLTDKNLRLKGNLNNTQEIKASEYISRANYTRCLRRILSDDVLINANTLSGGKNSDPILNVAATFNNQEALRLLIEKGAYIGLTGVTNEKDHDIFLSALRNETLEEAMDNCIKYQSEDGNEDNSPNDKNFSPNYSLSLDYRFLVPETNHGKRKDALKLNEMETLLNVSENDVHSTSIKHPLIHTLIDAKWSYVFWLYWVNLFLYMLFVVTLTLLMYCTVDYLREEGSRRVSNNTVEENNSGFTGSVLNHTLQVSRGFIIILTLYVILREAFEFYNRGFNYFHEIDNILELCLVPVAVIFFIPPFGHKVMKHFAAWSLILAGYIFVLIIGRHSKLSIYVALLRQVTKNFAKFFALFIVVILVFVMSFSFIFNQTQEFGNLFWAIPNVLFKSTGEFEYSDLRREIEETQPEVLTLISSVLFLLVFLFMIFLVLMNVINGLAVTDTQTVMKDAEIYSLKSKLELIFLAEQFALILETISEKCSFLFRSKISVLHKLHLISSPRRPKLLVKGSHWEKNLTVWDSEGIYMLCKLTEGSARQLKSFKLRYTAQSEAREREDNWKHCLKNLDEIRTMCERLQTDRVPPRQTHEVSFDLKNK